MRNGDTDITKAILGDTCKLLGNSSYGCTLPRKENIEKSHILILLVKLDLW
jgi:hypothetical protein